MPTTPGARSRGAGAARGVRHLRASRLLVRQRFNEAHVLAISQAICLYRQQAGHRRPAVPRHRHACAVAAGVRQRARGAGGQRRRGHDRRRATNTRRRRRSRTPSWSYNRGRKSGLADGIVITPSHNPPEDGGFKYNPPNGGPADTDITGWIEDQANALLDRRPAGRASASRSSRRCAPPPRTEHDFLERLRRRSRQRDRSRCDPRRRHPHGRRSAGRRRRALLGARSPSATGSTSPSSTRRSIRPSVS